MARPFTVYLSSTLSDLDAERAAVTNILSDECVVKHSYGASEDNLVTSCLNDVATCDLYIGILGARFGHVPGEGFKNQEGLSITELEYRQAGESGIPRHIFLKDDEIIPYGLTDAKTKEHPTEKIEAFRLRASSGNDQRPAVFRSVSELEKQVLKAFNAFKERQQRTQQKDEHGDAEAPRQRPPGRTNEDVRRAYIDWLRDDCEKVVLLGLDLRDRQNVRLGRVYVPALTSVPADRTGDGLLRSGGVESRQEPLLHRLARESLYVPGAPGSGKSTFCRWLSLVLASGAVPAHPGDLPDAFEEKMLDGLEGRFPFLCPLRQWAGNPDRLQGNGEWTRRQLEESLADWIDEVNPGGLTSVAWKEVLQDGQCVLILDGADEVPETVGEGSVHYPRRNFLSGLGDALPSWSRAGTTGNRVILTSRPYGVEDAVRRDLGLPLAELAELPRPLQDVFVHRWYGAAGAPDARAKARGLIEHLDGRPDLERLRPNPMLLTALCVKYDEDLRLPGDLYRLYSAVTDQVLYKRLSTEPERDLARLRLAAVALAMHEGPSEHPRTTPAAEVSYDEIDRALAELSETDTTSEQGGIGAATRREHLLPESGLLLPRGGRQAGFYHLSFQEFLAAVRLLRVVKDAPVADVLARHMSTPGWRHTLRFLFCALADQVSPEAALDEFSALLTRLERDALASDPNPALLFAACLEVGHARGWNLRQLEPAFRRACDHALDCVEPPARAELCRTLGRLGFDVRPGVGVAGGVPDIDWVEIPAGKFQFGEDGLSETLPAFRIARYPATCTQFQAFVDDGGFENDEWWRWPDQRVASARPSFAEPAHPRESVSWFDAMAFCAWLETRLRERGRLAPGWSVRLPKETEWEKAARGTDGREYPWGNEYRSGFANIDEAWGQVGEFYLQETSPVGIYSRGVSPYGVLDMAGNVLEWSLDAFDPEQRGESVPRVVRGGSWFNLRSIARATFRGSRSPVRRFDYVGFRVVCVSPIR